MLVRTKYKATKAINLRIVFLIRVLQSIPIYFVIVNSHQMMCVRTKCPFGRKLLIDDLCLDFIERLNLSRESKKIMLSNHYCPADREGGGKNILSSSIPLFAQTALTYVVGNARFSIFILRSLFLHRHQSVISTAE